MKIFRISACSAAIAFMMLGPAAAISGEEQTGLKELEAELLAIQDRLAAIEDRLDGWEAG